MPQLVTRCPHCRGKLGLKKESYVGKKIRCPRCEEPFVVKPIAASADKAAPSKSTADRSSASKQQRQQKRQRPEPAASSDDDWLDGIGSYEDDDAMAVADAAPPAVVGQPRKKKKKKRSVPQKNSGLDSLRDEDGDLPLALHRVMMVFTGLVGGAIGAVIWGAIIYFSEYEVGFVAILVGALVGTGVRVGASRYDYGWWPAMTAVGVAAFSIIVGKALGIYFLFSSMTGEFAEMAESAAAYAAHDNAQIEEIADEIIYKREEAGEEINYPEEPDDFDYSDPELVAQLYPPEIWAEAKTQWDALDDAEKQRRKAEAREVFGEGGFGGLGRAAGMTLIAAFAVVLSFADPREAVFNLLWFGLACSGAFKIAAGMEDED